MMGCSAPYCPNLSSEGFQMYRFPADLERRKKWLMNFKYANWEPTQNARLCSIHFDDSQFEQRRAGGKRKLLSFAVPTLFNCVKEVHDLKQAKVFESLPSILHHKRIEDPLAKLNKQVELEEKLKQENQQCEDSVKMYERIIELEEKLKQQSEITSDLRNKYVLLEEKFKVHAQALLLEWS